MSAALMLAALTIEALLGWPAWLYRRIGHPVVWIGALITALEGRWNRPVWRVRTRFLLGALTVVLVTVIAALIAHGIATGLPDTLLGHAMEALIAASLLAARSLHDHVAAVARPLRMHDLPAARRAVSHIVGRDPAQLAPAGVARAGLESLAENTSDGVIAPLFWGVLLGLPGLAAYKTLNTLDSMIGHRTPRMRVFGACAARADDLANWIPARLTGLLFAVAGWSHKAWQVMVRDAHRHRSPNAGWPESAMAGALNIRLSGPRDYGHGPSRDPWLNAGAPDPTAADLVRGLALYRRAMVLAALVLAGVAWGTWP